VHTGERKLSLSHVVTWGLTTLALGYKTPTGDIQGGKTMKANKVLVVILSFLFVVLLLGGSVASASEARGSIRYSSMWNPGEPQAQWIRKQADAFTEKTGIKVEINFVGRPVLTQIMTQILVGDAPDIVDHDLSEVTSALLASGEEQATPLDDILNAPAPDGEARLRDVFNQEILALYEFNGKNYFVPYIYITSGFYYDKRLWNEVGAKIPSTWAELIEAGEKFKAAGLGFIAQDAGSSPLYNAYYYYWACQRVLGAGNYFAASMDPTGKKWDDPGLLRAAELINELSSSGKHMFLSGYESSTWPAARTEVALGNAAAILCGTWVPVEAKDLVDPEFQWGYFPFPAVEGGKGTLKQMEAYLIGWAIPKGAKNPDAAKEFLVFMSARDRAQGVVDTALNMSARRDIGLPGVLIDVGRYLSEAETFFLSYDAVSSRNRQWFVNTFYPINDALIQGRIKPEEFIKQIKEATIAFHARTK